MNNEKLEIVITNGTDERFISLCRKLDDCLNEIVGGEKQRSQYIQYNTLKDIHDVVMIQCNGKPVGCGSFKKYSDTTAEVKRVFVSEEYRGKKLGRTIIEKVEAIAKEQGYQKLVLETGALLTSAIHLYKNLGFEIIDNYGPYVKMTDSICMEKGLDN